MTQIQKQNYLLSKNSSEEQSIDRPKVKKRNYLDYVKLLNKIIFCFIIFNAAYFIFNVNDLSIKGFVLNSQKAKLYEISEENRSLELKITKMGSLEDIEKRAIAMKLVKVDKIDYLTVKEDAVAMR